MFSLSSIKASASKLAKQSVLALSTLAATVIDPALSTTTSSSASTQDEQQEESARDELQRLFESVVLSLQTLQSDADPAAVETDPRLHASLVGAQLKRIVQLLKNDSDQWLAFQRRLGMRRHSESESENNAPSHELEESDTPCLDVFIQHNMIQTLCNHTLSDLPRGVMPMLLKFLSLLLRSVEYPLLPHQSIHRPIAKLVSTATRYDAMVGLCTDYGKTAKERETYVQYKKRIDITLTGLIKIIWWKIHQNPPILDYFILTDKRMQRLGIENGFELYRSPRAVSLRPTTVTPSTVSSSSPPRMQLDILQALLPLLYEPKLCEHTQKSLLLALHVRDSRVFSFLSQHTTLSHTLVSALCDAFSQTLSAVSLSLCESEEEVPALLRPLCVSQRGLTTSTPQRDRERDRGGSAHTTRSHNAALSAAASRLTETLRLLCATHNAATQREAELRCESHSLSLSLSLARAFDSLFLRRALCARVVSSHRGSEKESVALYGVLRVVLEELARLSALSHNAAGCVGDEEVFEEALCGTRCTVPHGTHGAQKSQSERDRDRESESASRSQSLAQRRRVSLSLSLAAQTETESDTETEREALSLLALTTRALLLETTSDGEHAKADNPSKLSRFYWLLADRAASPSKALAVSATLLLQTILATAPPVLAVELACRSSSSRSGTHGAVHGAVQPQTPRSQVPKDLNTQTPSRSQTPSVSEPQTPSTPVPQTPNPPMAKWSSSQSLSFSVSLSLDDALARTVRAMESERQRERESPLRVSRDSLRRCVDRSVCVLLRRGRERVRETRTVREKETESETESDALCERVVRRLGAFLSLRADEQLALSALLYELLVAVALSLSLSPAEGASQPALTTTPPHTPHAHHPTHHTSHSYSDSEREKVKERERARCERLLLRLLHALRTQSALKSESVARLNALGDAPQRLSRARRWLCGAESASLSHTATHTQSHTYSYIHNTPHTPSHTHTPHTPSQHAHTAPSHTHTETARESERERDARLLSAESPAVKQLLCGAVVLTEMLAETQSLLYALQIVRRSSARLIPPQENTHREREISIYANVERDEQEERERLSQDVRDVCERVRDLGLTVREERDDGGVCDRRVSVEDLCEEFKTQCEAMEREVEAMCEEMGVVCGASDCVMEGGSEVIV